MAILSVMSVSTGEIITFGEAAFDDNQRSHCGSSDSLAHDLRCIRDQ